MKSSPGVRRPGAFILRSLSPIHVVGFDDSDDPYHAIGERNGWENMDFSGRATCLPGHRVGSAAPGSGPAPLPIGPPHLQQPSPLPYPRTNTSTTRGSSTSTGPGHDEPCARAGAGPGPAAGRRRAATAEPAEPGEAVFPVSSGFECSRPGADSGAEGVGWWRHPWSYYPRATSPGE